MRPFFHGVRMASDLYYSPFIPAFSSSGAPSAGAKLRFRYTGTTTAAPIYSDAALTVPLTNPVVANAAGRFPPIYMNDAITYRIDYLSPTNAQLDSVDPYVPGVTSAVLTVASGAYVSTRVALAAISAPVNGQIATLTEAGREGVFRFSTANLSAQVTLDTGQGIYVAPAAATSGASGAWVRVVGPGEPWQASWFGLPTGGDDTTIMQSIENMKEDGRAVHFGAGTFQFRGIQINKAGHWRGVGKATVFQNNSTSPEKDTFGVSTSGGTRISHARFTGVTDVSNADARFSINVSPRSNVVTTAEEMEDFEFDHLWFDGCDTGIRVSYGGRGPSNDIPGTTWYTPKRAHIHDCVFEDVLYQAIIPEAHDIVIERCRFKLTSKPGGGYRPFSHFLRILGCNRLTVRDNYFECPADYEAIDIQNSGVDNGLSNVAYRSSANVTIDSNRFRGGYIAITHPSERLRITRNTFWNNPTETTTHPDACIYGQQSNFPIYFSHIEVEDNYAVGYPVFALIENLTCHTISIKRNTQIGNQRSFSTFTGFGVKLQVNNGLTYQDGVTQIKPPVLIEIEDNNFFVNPSMVGRFVYLVGKMDGMHLRYAGNKTSERSGGGIGHVGVSGLVGDFQCAFSKTASFGAWTASAVTQTADVVGDNVSMPSGFYAALTPTAIFRDEQIISPYPPTFA